jgi:hypothetical protein
MSPNWAGGFQCKPDHLGVWPDNFLITLLWCYGDNRPSWLYNQRLLWHGCVFFIVLFWYSSWSQRYKKIKPALSIPRPNYSPGALYLIWHQKEESDGNFGCKSFHSWTIDSIPCCSSDFSVLFLVLSQLLDWINIIFILIRFLISLSRYPNYPTWDQW